MGWHSTAKPASASPSTKKRTTHDPEEPPLHLTDRDHVTGVHDKVGKEERRNPERRVEVPAEQPKRPEESLHRKERDVVEQQEREVRSRASVETRHEVDDDGEDQRPDEGEGDVGKGVGDDDGGGAVHPVRRLLAHDGATQHHHGHLTEGVEADGQHGCKDHGATGEGALGGEREIEVSATEDKSEELREV